jgi:hypothetical protein
MNTDQFEFKRTSKVELSAGDALQVIPQLYHSYDLKSNTTV